MIEDPVYLNLFGKNAWIDNAKLAPSSLRDIDNALFMWMK